MRGRPPLPHRLLSRCVMLCRFNPVLRASNAMQMRPVWFKRDSSPVFELRLN